MRTDLLSASDPSALQRALAVLRAGGLVAFPTDTVYGLGAVAFDPAAIERIYLAKDRSLEKAIPILIGETEDLARVTAHLPPSTLTLAARFWPGPLTLVVPRHVSIPDALSPLRTVGVRMPDHPLARALLRIAGPLAVTSANLSGGANPSSAQQVMEQLTGRIELVLDGGRAPGGVPSTVVDCLGPEPVILREGPVTRDQIRAALGLDLSSNT